MDCWAPDKSERGKEENVAGNVGITYKHCCSGKAIWITYSKCVLVALVIQHALRMRHIVICGLPGSVVLFHTIS